MNTNRTAVITGGAQGIGKGLVSRFLKAGYTVVMTDCDGEAGSAAVRDLEAQGGLHFIAGDIASELHVERLTGETIALTGGIDVLINNAAIAHGSAPTELALEDWNRVLAVNLTAPFLCAKHMAPSLRERRGTIINIASTRAFMSEPNTEAYSASKGGIVALTHALAASLAPAIRVNSISPGWIHNAGWQKPDTVPLPTPTLADHAQHWSGRVGTPDDIAGLALYLASPESQFITGSNFIIDGGMTHKMIYA